MTRLLILSVLSFVLLTGCTEARVSEETYTAGYNGKYQLATFSGGCFWCIEAPFEEIDGIISVKSGYSGGKKENATYAEVSSGKTNHKEAVQIVFDPEVISFTELLDVFWQQFDPTDGGGSFHDRGLQYTSTVFYHSPQQKTVAEASKKRLDSTGKFEKPVITSITKYSNFYPAEESHQDYYKKHPKEYQSYRKESGRDQFITAHWEVPDSRRYPAPSKTVLKAKLSDLQYKVTMEEATEPAFNNAFDSNEQKGIYVCIVSGAPLFSSADKFDSKTGWPSFTKPIDTRFLEKKIDSTYGMTRVEVRSKFGNTHSGHVFNDGPPPSNLRYCMNSSSFRFIPRENMEEKGYGQYLWTVN